MRDFFKKNNPVHTRPVSPASPGAPSIEQRWIVTYSIPSDFKGMRTQVITGDIEQWINSNTQPIQIIFCQKI